ncbi:unnamed protein product [Linum tenue]|uniref:Uncharacterized protein n=1 Tax=Linum tenue TaxID=586396 RepID=A0AAV0LWH5_9ROSI|nr:unnamed protein product [Linum tenue]
MAPCRKQCRELFVSGVQSTTSSTAVPLKPISTAFPDKAADPSKPSLPIKPYSHILNLLPRVGFVRYTALVLFCGAATYLSFPFSENAKHKKTQLLRYAPLPEDLHTNI